MANGLRVGANAPDFTLLEAPGKSITLSNELKKGPVVLVFFPAAFSPVCTQEVCRFRDAMEDYNKLKARVLGISVDGIFSLSAFKQANQIQYPLLSDWEKKTIRAYGIVYPDLAGMKEVAKRSVFVIAKNGKVAFSWISENPAVLPPFDEIRQAVEKAS